MRDIHLSHCAVKLQQTENSLYKNITINKIHDYVGLHVRMSNLHTPEGYLNINKHMPAINCYLF